MKNSELGTYMDSYFYKIKVQELAEIFYGLTEQVYFCKIKVQELAKIFYRRDFYGDFKGSLYRYA